MDGIMFICQGWKCQKSENRSQTRLKKETFLHAELTAAKWGVLLIRNVEETAVENWKLDCVSNSSQHLMGGSVREEMRWRENTQIRWMKTCMNSLTALREVMNREQEKVTMTTHHLTLIVWCCSVASIWGHCRWWTLMFQSSTFMCSCFNANANNTSVTFVEFERSQSLTDVLFCAALLPSAKYNCCWGKKKGWINNFPQFFFYFLLFLIFKPLFSSNHEHAAVRAFVYALCYWTKSWVKSAEC